MSLCYRANLITAGKLFYHCFSPRSATPLAIIQLIKINLYKTYLHFRNSKKSHLFRFIGINSIVCHYKIHALRIQTHWR